MKFWEFVRVSKDLQLDLALALSEPDHAHLRVWFEAWDQLLKTQDRTILDHELEPDVCEFVFAQAERGFYLCGPRLRFNPLGACDRITALEAFQRFGGTAMEEAIEKGSIKVC